MKNSTFPIEQLINEVVAIHKPLQLKRNLTSHEPNAF